MQTSAQFTMTQRSNRPPSLAIPADSVDDALRTLQILRESARERLDRFSLDTLRRWSELDHEIECKLEDIECRLSATGETESDVVLVRVTELTRALQELLDGHLHCRAHSLMQPAVRSCSPSDSLERAAQLLWEGDCGALAVIDEQGSAIGMITDRDICIAAYTQGKPLRDCSVSSAMSKSLSACAPNDSLEQVLAIMGRRQVRRLPVVETGGRLVGIVSLADVSKYLDGLPPDHVERVLLVPTLAAICERRGAGS